MKRSTVGIALYLMLVFGSGIVVGAFGLKLYTAKEVNAAKVQPQRMSPEVFRKKYSEELNERLKLTDVQAKRLSEILDETKQQFDSFNARTRPEAEKIKQHQRESIRAMLNASQLPEYEKILEERSKRGKNKNR